MKQNHIIHKVIVEITVGNKDKAHAIKDNINSFLSIDVFPKLEKYIHALQDKLPEQTLQISRLTLNINEESELSLNANLKNSIAKQFKETLKEVTKPVMKTGSVTDDSGGISRLTDPEKQLRTFIYFIEKGYLPWWNSNESTINILEPEVFKKMTSTQGFESCITALIQKPEVRTRIINQLTNVQIKQMCLAVLKNKNFSINLEAEVVKHLSKLTVSGRNSVWSLILNMMGKYLNNAVENHEKYLLQQISKLIPFVKTSRNYSEAKTFEAIIQIFPSVGKNHDITILFNQRFKSTQEKEKGREQAYISGKSGSPGENQEKEVRQAKQTDSFLRDDVNVQIDSNTQSDYTDTADENSGYHVQNAGLILIHPFMNNLFKYCNLVDPKTQKLTDPELCIHLLHYIATGKTNQPESNMLFEKFLCSVPLHQSISRHVKLSRKHKTHAKKVIEAVQQNWSAMKTAPAELLQNEFLQRPGKLVLNDSPTLTIERKAQDILLDKLSWGIGLIRLPWQSQFIYANW